MSKAKAMKNYANFREWLDDQDAALRPTSLALRKLIQGASTRLVETVKWGNACWIYDELPVVYLYAADDLIQLGFFAGSYLEDPKGLLQGKAKFVRFIELRSPDDIAKTYFTKLIKQAIKIKYR